MPPCFVLVHGAWHGGWCWDEVVRRLEAEGARCYAPTLAGLAYRRSQGSPATTADDHAVEIIRLVHMLDLHGVVLALHSYAGMLGPSLLAALRPRLRHITWIEAVIPPPDAALLDLVPPEAASRYRAAAEGTGGWLAPPPVQQFDVRDPGLEAEVAARLTPQPWRTFSEAPRLTQDDVDGFRCSYLVADDRPAAPYVTFASRAGAAGWPVQQTGGGHLLMLTRPDTVRRFLLEAGTAAP